MTATVDDKTIYAPHGACRDLFYCRDTEVLLEGPAGTGKSRAALEKAHLCAMKYPGARILVIRQTRESMTESVLVTFEDWVVPAGSPLVAGARRPQRHSYDYPNGSSIIVSGFRSSGRDQKAKVMSTEYDIIIIPEATEVTQADYEQVLTRLRNGAMPYQQAICDCNPAGRMHWLNLRANEGGMTRLLTRHEDNPRLHNGDGWTDYGAAYIAKLDRLTGHRKERLRYGRWATAEGVVYENFDRNLHVIPRFDIPDDWRRVRVVDFGFTNPFVCQWWALDGDGRAYLYREVYRTKRIVARHASQILALSNDEYIEATVADHDAEDRATLHEAGINTIPAKKDVSPGINAVIDRLAKAGDGRPRMFFFDDALVERDPLLDEAKKPCCTVEEFDGYIWPKGQDGKPMKEQPVKEDDHGMDAMRYMAMHLDGPTAFVGVASDETWEAGGAVDITDNERWGWR